MKLLNDMSDIQIEALESNIFFSIHFCLQSSVVVMLTLSILLLLSFGFTKAVSLLIIKSNHSNEELFVGGSY